MIQTCIHTSHLSLGKENSWRTFPFQHIVADRILGVFVFKQGSLLFQDFFEKQCLAIAKWFACGNNSFFYHTLQLTNYR